MKLSLNMGALAAKKEETKQEENPPSSESSERSEQSVEDRMDTGDDVNVAAKAPLGGFSLRLPINLPVGGSQKTDLEEEDEYNEDDLDETEPVKKPAIALPLSTAPKFSLKIPQITATTTSSPSQPSSSSSVSSPRENSQILSGSVISVDMVLPNLCNIRSSKISSIDDILSLIENDAGTIKSEDVELYSLTPIKSVEDIKNSADSSIVCKTKQMACKCDNTKNIVKY